jgi:SNF2 family DNA or RNA helicase
MSGEEITPVNAAAMYSILLQYCNGAVYRPDKTYEVVDNAKLDALVEAVEALNGSPVIIFYQFISDKERILKKLPQARLLEGSQGIDDWNAGKIEVLVLHGASAGHGINMQDAGVGIFWMGVPWSLELYQQANARVHRQGRKTPVLIKHFITRGTVEELVLQRLGDKSITQDALIEALKRYLK